jgi:hypothetical protein
MSEVRSLGHGDDVRIKQHLPVPAPGCDPVPSDRVKDVGEKVIFQHRRRFGCEPAPELTRLNQRHNQPRQAEWRNIVADGALRLTPLEDDGHPFGHSRRTALQRGADARLELESVRVFKQDAEHRSGMQVVEVLRRKKVAKPFVHLLVFGGKRAQVRRRLLGNAVERSGEQFGFGAEVLEDDGLGHPDACRDIGHPRLLVARGRENRDSCVEDSRAAIRGGQASSSRRLKTVVVRWKWSHAHC